MNKRRVAILGSTGSIGTQALEIIEAFPELLEVEVLTAYANADLLIAQAKKFKPNAVVIVKEDAYETVKSALWNEDIKVFAGEKSLHDIVEMSSIDIVLNALVGFSGLQPTLNALNHEKAVALANKETLVAGGSLVMQTAAEHKTPIFPVDSEHSAIFQCLQGEFHNPVQKLILTASGGPFRTKDLKFLETVTPEQALNHPNWNMGHKVTIDSATLLNKGLEVIEAHWLFGVDYEHIEIQIHPQSVIHSLVQFTDSSIKAQLGLPSMKLPIQYALTYPQRQTSLLPEFNFGQYPSLTFEAVNHELFPCLNLAYEAGKKGGNLPTVLNAANEIAVALFLNGQIPFTQIPVRIQKAMEQMPFISNPNLDEIIQTDLETRDFSLKLKLS